MTPRDVGDYRVGFPALGNMRPAPPPPNASDVLNPQWSLRRALPQPLRRRWQLPATQQCATPSNRVPLRSSSKASSSVCMVALMPLPLTAVLRAVRAA
jgi:hypothetical protein